MQHKSNSEMIDFVGLLNKQLISFKIIVQNYKIYPDVIK